MDKLKLLQLKYVQLTGSYKNFPEIRWLCWHGFSFKTLHPDLFMTNLVAIDMSYGNLEVFEPPMDLESLKILNLKGSYRLVSVRNLCRLPNLETLILLNCTVLDDVCKTIGDLKRLALLDLTGCINLQKVSSNENDVYLGSQQELWFSLPQSLQFFSLNNCSLTSNSNVTVVSSGQPFFYLNLGNNLCEFLPDSIDLKMLRVLDMTSCPRLKSLLCLPSTLEELYTHLCESLEKITFQSAQFRLRKFGHEGCYNLSEIQGLYKLVSIVELGESDLGHMKWLKSYQDGRVEMIGHAIKIHRNQPIQMLYEYGIMSAFLPGVEDRSITYEYRSSSPFLSFHVPTCPMKSRIRGLNIAFLYRLSGEVEDMLVLFTKISNTMKGRTWIYNPVVFCKPRVDEDALWVSYWPIGNTIDTGDEVNVSIIVGNGLMVSGCRASLVYSDGEVEKEIWENNPKWEEVIGGDLSEFELSTAGYYLCRRDFFKSTDGKTPDWFKSLVGDAIPYTEIKGWRKSCQLQWSRASFTETKYFRGMLGIKVVVQVNVGSDGSKIFTKIAALVGTESIALDQKNGTLTVTGDVDPVEIVSCLRKITRTEIISVGPAKLYEHEPEMGPLASRARSSSSMI